MAFPLQAYLRSVVAPGVASGRLRGTVRRAIWPRIRRRAGGGFKIDRSRHGVVPLHRYTSRLEGESTWEVLRDQFSQTTSCSRAQLEDRGCAIVGGATNGNPGDSDLFPSDGSVRNRRVAQGYMGGGRPATAKH